MRIEVRNLKKSYHLNAVEIPVLKGVELTIGSGEFVSLTGPSGVGKSTLLHLLGMLDAPSDGEIILDGQSVSQMSAPSASEFRNRKIGFVFQFHHLLPELSALENTMMPLWIRRDRKETLSRAKDMLAHVGLSHRLMHKPGELSGGEQQRVALARALIGEPKLLLADEPTGNLDEETGEHVLMLMQDYARKNGATMLVVTHHQRTAALASRQLVLENSGLRELTEL